MPFIPKSVKTLSVIGGLVLVLGLTMVIYWSLYIIRQMPIKDVPILSELITALLALVTGFGLICRKRWAVPFCLVLSGMWAYGVIGGIALVLQHGLSFESPFGAIIDAALFPLILLFAFWMAATVWINRKQFGRAT